MSRNTIIAGCVAIALIAIGGWYLLSFPIGGSAALTNSAVGTTTSTTASDTGVSALSGNGSNQTTLKTVLAKGGNYTCTLETFKNDEHITGTAYGTTNKFRLDLIVSQNGIDTRTHIIHNGTTAYTWVDGKMTGVLSTVAAGSSIVQPSGMAVSIDENTNVTTDCHPWIPNSAEFVPPAAITFVSQ